MTDNDDLYGPGVVVAIEPGSPAESAGVLSGDLLWAVDGQPMRDLIDYYLLMADDVAHGLELERNGFHFELEIDATCGNPGIELESPLFGRLVECDNHCIFCFVDQLPPGLKEQMYIKDDDYRLSFLQGNFITLINLDQNDVERIIEDGLSPLYVSLHTTDPDLRRLIFGNLRAARSMNILKELLDAGINLHIQLVLMHGLNDGRDLDKTLGDLRDRFAGVASIGAVPVGISWNCRTKVPSHYSFGPGSASEVLDILDRWHQEFGDAGPFAADEFFYLAGLPAPEMDYYAEFAQTENGIGLARLFRDSFSKASDRMDLPNGCEGTALVTTPIGEWALSGLGIETTGARMLVCENSLFGPRVNVCGLLPGADVTRALRSANGLGRALVPDIAIDGGGAFIDGITLETVARDTGIDIESVACEGNALVDALWNSREGRGNR